MRCYVLFAGSQRTPHGGLADLVGIFTSEAAARQAFQHLRLNQTSAIATIWAQLAEIDGDRGIRALSWFGIGATPARTPGTFARPKKLIQTQTEGGVMQVETRGSRSPAGEDVAPIARRHPLKRIEVWLVGVAAVAAITIGVVSDDGTTRPATSKPAPLDRGGPASSLVAPLAVDDSVLADATSGAQR